MWIGKLKVGNYETRIETRKLEANQYLLYVLHFKFSIWMYILSIYFTF